MDLTNIYRLFYPKVHIFFFHIHMEYSPGQIMCQSTKCLIKFKNYENTSSIFSGHNTTKLEIIFKEKRLQKKKKNHRHEEVTQYATTQPLLKELKKKNLNTWRQIEMITQQYKKHGQKKKQVKAVHKGTI